jgi:DNA-binding response OmpR family regulator
MKYSNTQRKILVAEDDDSMRRFIEVTLRKAGYAVVSVEDGLLAMKSMFEADFDAIVADAVMPHLSGFDLCRMLRHADGCVEKKDTPFIILSGLEKNAGADNHLADVYLRKDNNIKENLIKTLDAVLDKSSV